MGSSSERTRTAITAALKKKLKDIMGEFSALRQKLQLEYRWRPAGSCVPWAQAAMMPFNSTSDLCPTQGHAQRRLQTVK